MKKLPFHKPPTRIEQLARAILRDRRDKQQSSPPPLSCFACGHAYSRGDGRFCQNRCRAAFDAGLPAHKPLDTDKFYTLPKSNVGFRIDCVGCKKSFDSTGLRCCSTECERELHRKQALDAELAGDPFRVVKCKCLDCGGNIPNWRKGRRVSKATKFCSPRCKDRYGKSAQEASDSQKPVLARETAKKPHSNGLRPIGHTVPSVSAEGLPSGPLGCALDIIAAEAAP